MIQAKPIQQSHKACPPMIVFANLWTNVVQERIKRNKVPLWQEIEKKILLSLIYRDQINLNPRLLPQVINPVFMNPTLLQHLSLTLITLLMNKTTLLVDNQTIVHLDHKKGQVLDLTSLLNIRNRPPPSSKSENRSDTFTDSHTNQVRDSQEDSYSKSDTRSVNDSRDSRDSETISHSKDDRKTQYDNRSRNEETDKSVRDRDESVKIKKEETGDRKTDPKNIEKPSDTQQVELKKQIKKRQILQQSRILKKPQGDLASQQNKGMKEGGALLEAKARGDFSNEPLTNGSKKSIFEFEGMKEANVLEGYSKEPVSSASTQSLGDGLLLNPLKIENEELLANLSASPEGKLLVGEKKDSTFKLEGVSGKTMNDETTDSSAEFGGVGKSDDSGMNSKKIDVKKVTPEAITGTQSTQFQTEITVENGEPIRPATVHELVTQIVDRVQIMKKEDLTQTMITLRNPPILAGSTITLTASDHAKKEFNISFANLSPDAKIFLDNILKEQSLTTALESKGLTVHILTTSTQAEQPFIVDDKQPQQEREGQHQGQQRDNQQEQQQQKRQEQRQKFKG